MFFKSLEMFCTTLLIIFAYVLLFAIIYVTFSFETIFFLSLLHLREYVSVVKSKKLNKKQKL
jgi:hypothetical protein